MKIGLTVATFFCCRYNSGGCYCFSSEDLSTATTSKVLALEKENPFQDQGSLLFVFASARFRSRVQGCETSRCHLVS